MSSEPDAGHLPNDVVGGRLQEFARRFAGEWADRAIEPAGIVDFATYAVPHTVGAGLTLVSGSGVPSILASSNELVAQVDVIETECGEGPCLDAIEHDDITSVGDLTSDRRWPKFSERTVRETPIRSMFGVRVFLSGDARGALNFYAPQVDAFTQLDLGIGAMLSTFCSLALRNAVEQRRSANLEVALESSRQIGTAIGILMTRTLITADQAFDQLREASQRTHRKLRDLAIEVSETGALPEGGRNE